MPELPEVETVCRTLHPLLRGRHIVSSEVYWRRTIEPLEPDEFNAAVSRKAVRSVSRRGKYVVLVLSDGLRLTIHLRMTGELRYQESGVRFEKEHLRVLFKLDGGASILFFDIRKFGRIRVLTQEDWLEFDRNLGYEPLDSRFTSEVFRNVLRQRSRGIKALLLDQSIIAGLGNIYIDEALFRARIHPRQTSDTISTVKATRLHAAIQEILISAIERRGTTLRNYRSGLGEPGENQMQLQVYGSPRGAPCPRCGRALKRTTVNQRTTTFCSNCQRRRSTRSTSL